MKRLLVFVFAMALLGSCTVTLYDGKIYPSNVEFNQPNFIYIKTIKGSAEATFNAFGWDKEKSDGLVNEAKKNMYLRHPLKANQVPTNVTVDILKVGEPNSLAKSGVSLTKVKVIVTADIFEFYEGDVPIQEFNSEIKNKINDNNSKDIVKEIENKEEISEEQLGEIMNGYNKYTDGISLSRGTKVIFKDGEDYYYGIMKYQINKSGSNKVIDIYKYDFDYEDWVLSEKEEVSIPVNIILGYKL